MWDLKNTQLQAKAGELWTWKLVCMIYEVHSAILLSHAIDAAKESNGDDEDQWTSEAENCNFSDSSETDNSVADTRVDCNVRSNLNWIDFFSRLWMIKQLMCVRS